MTQISFCWYYNAHFGWKKYAVNWLADLGVRLHLLFTYWFCLCYRNNIWQPCNQKHNFNEIQAHLI